MSQNIVAICDVDSTLVDSRLAQWREPGGGRPQGRRQGRRPTRRRARRSGRNGARRRSSTDADTRFPRQDRRRQSAEVRRAAAPRIQRYADYREMLAKQKDIDAVIVATPDHMHAVIASAAMDLGKHVYVQKPMAWCVSEARHLAKRAAETKVQAQCGNQRHSGDEHRRGVDYITSGAIGDVSHVHVWTNRPILAAGPAAAEAVHRRSRAATESADGAPGRDGRGQGQRHAAVHAGVGPLPRRRAGGRLRPDLSPVQLARLGGLGTGCAGRHGRAPDRLPGLGAGSRPADIGRNHVDAVQRHHVSDWRR